MMFSGVVEAPSWRGLANSLRLMVVTVMLTITIVVSHFMSGEHDDQRVLQIGFLSLAILVVAARDCMPSFQLFLGGIGGLLLALFFALGAVSSLRADSPVNGLREVLLFVLLLVVALCVARELNRDYAARLDLVLTIVGAGCALYVFVVGVIWLTAVLTNTHPTPFSFAPSFTNYRFLNHAQTVSMPLLILLACRCNPRHRKMWIGVAMFWAFLVLGLSGRGTVLGIVVGCAVAIALFRQRSLYFVKTLLLSALAGFLLVWIFFIWIPGALGMEPFGTMLTSVGRTVGSDPTSMRVLLWARALAYIGAHPWLGIGPAHYGRYAFDIDNGSHPHDWPLQIGAEWGIPALLCLVAVIWTASSRLLKTSRALDPGDTPNHLIATTLVVTGVAILVDGCVSGLIVMPVSQLLIALYIGCAAGWVWSFNAGQEVERQSGPRLALAATLLASVVALVLCTAHDFGGLDGKLRVHPEVTFLHPRFWVQEYFTDDELRKADGCGHGRQPACR